jgi:hypothetical protein
VLDKLHIAVPRLCMALVLRLSSQHLLSSFPSLLPIPSFLLFLLFFHLDLDDGSGIRLFNYLSELGLSFIFCIMCFSMTGQASIPVWCFKGRLLSYRLMVTYLATLRRLIFLQSLFLVLLGMGQFVL